VKVTGKHCLRLISCWPWGSFFNTEDGGSTFFRNIDMLLQDYMTSPLNRK
jgi:hypothetical protein